MTEQLRSEQPRPWRQVEIKKDKKLEEAFYEAHLAESIDMRKQTWAKFCDLSKDAYPDSEPFYVYVAYFSRSGLRY